MWFRIKQKGKCYLNHSAKCNKNAASYLLNSTSCSYCGKIYKNSGKWYSKHVACCKMKSESLDSYSKLPNSNVDSAFDFSDDYFTESASDAEDSYSESNLDSWKESLNKCCIDH